MNLLISTGHILVLAGVLLSFNHNINGNSIILFVAYGLTLLFLTKALLSFKEIKTFFLYVGISCIWISVALAFDDLNFLISGLISVVFLAVYYIPLLKQSRNIIFFFALAVFIISIVFVFFILVEIPVNKIVSYFLGGIISFALILVSGIKYFQLTKYKEELSLINFSGVYPVLVVAIFVLYTQVGFLPELYSAKSNIDKEVHELKGKEKLTTQEEINELNILIHEITE